MGPGWQGGWGQFTVSVLQFSKYDTGVLIRRGDFPKNYIKNIAFGMLLDRILADLLYIFYMESIDRKKPVLVNLSKQDRRMLEFLAKLEQESLSGEVRRLIRTRYRSVKGE